MSAAAADGAAGRRVALPARLTLPHVTQALHDVQAALAAGGDLRLDASGVEDLDTSAVALLLQARRLAQAAGVDFHIDAVPAKLQALATLYGVEALLSSDGSTGSASSAGKADLATGASPA